MISLEFEVTLVYSQSYTEKNPDLIPPKKKQEKESYSAALVDIS